MTTDDAGDGTGEISGILAGLRLDHLIAEVQERLAEIASTRRRTQRLLDAVLGVAAGLELDTTLQRIVQSAVDLVDARYGALGVLAPDGSIAGTFGSTVGPDSTAITGPVEDMLAGRS